MGVTCASENALDMGSFGLLKHKPQDLYKMTLLTLVPALHQLIGNTIFCYFGAHGGEEN